MADTRNYESEIRALVLQRQAEQAERYRLLPASAWADSAPSAAEQRLTAEIERLEAEWQAATLAGGVA